MGQKYQKMHEIAHILVCNFYQIAVTKQISHPSYFNILAWNFEYNFSTKFGS